MPTTVTTVDQRSTPQATTSFDIAAASAVAQAAPRLTPVCDACDWLSTPERDGDARSDPWLVLHTGTVGSDPVLYPGDTDWCGR